jgi:hypothetical protein
MSGASKADSAAPKLDPSGGSDALRKLRNGEITLEDYLDVTSDLAVDHLRGKLSEERLKLVRETVRAELATDPALAEMIAAATGVRPG